MKRFLTAIVVLFPFVGCAHISFRNTQSVAGCDAIEFPEPVVHRSALSVDATSLEDQEPSRWRRPVLSDVQHSTRNVTETGSDHPALGTPVNNATLWTPTLEAMSAPSSSIKTVGLFVPPAPDSRETDVTASSTVQELEMSLPTVPAQAGSDITAEDLCVPEFHEWKALLDEEQSRLTDRVAELERQLAANHETIDELGQQLADSKAEIRQLEAEVGEWQARVGSIEERVTEQHQLDVAILDELSTQLETMLQRQVQAKPSTVD